MTEEYTLTLKDQEEFDQKKGEYDSFKKMEKVLVDKKKQLETRLETVEKQMYGITHDVEISKKNKEVSRLYFSLKKNILKLKRSSNNKHLLEQQHILEKKINDTQEDLYKHLEKIGIDSLMKEYAEIKDKIEKFNKFLVKHQEKRKTLQDDLLTYFKSLPKELMSKFILPTSEM